MSAGNKFWFFVRFVLLSLITFRTVPDLVDVAGPGGAGSDPARDP